MNSWKDKFPKDLQEKIAEVDEMISGRLRNSRNQDMSFWRYASGRYALLYDRNAL